MTGHETESPMREFDPHTPGGVDQRELEVGRRLSTLTVGSFLSDIANRHGEREAMVSRGRRTSSA